MSKYKLILDCIGKYHDISFDLDDVTIFYGPNEAGKTTIIDAMINCMVVASKRKYLYSKVLTPRYGDDISTNLKVVKTNDEIERLDHDLVRNLLVVRASTLDLEFKSSKTTEASWLEEVRNKLFAGGVDPKAIIGAIEDMERKTKSSGSPLYEVKQLEMEISDLESDLSRKRNDIRNKQLMVQQQDRLKHDASELDEELAKVSGKIELKTKLLYESRKSLEKDEIHDLHGKISKIDKLKQKIRLSDHLKRETLSQLRNFQDEIKNLQNQRQSKTIELTRKQDELSSLEKQIAPKQKSIEKLRNDHDLARRTQNSIEQQLSVKHEAPTARPTGLLIIGTVLLLGGLILLSVFPESMKYYGILISLFGLGIFGFTFFNKPKATINNVDIKKDIRFFNQQFKELPSCPDDSFAHANDFLRDVVEKFKTAHSELDINLDRKIILELEISDLQKRIQNISTELQKQMENLKLALPNGIHDGEEYARQLQSKESDEVLLNNLENSLKDAARIQGVSDTGELTRLVEHKIIEFNNNPVTSTVERKGIKVLESEVASLGKQKEELLKRREGVGIHLTRSSTEVQILVGGLSREVLELEKRIFKLNQQKYQKLLVMDSFRLLKEIVTVAASDATGEFAGLNQGINKYMKVILGKERQVTFENLESLDNITCVDCSGVSRDVMNLSSGTKDAFVLAARLALLEKVNVPKHSFLILDDPFIHLDQERMQKGIEAIKLFHQEHEMPLLFFTKDRETKDRFCTIFEDALLIDLKMDGKNVVDLSPKRKAA